MSWFRRYSKHSVGPHHAPRKRLARLTVNAAEQLEQKLLLGSLVPTETGVPTGELLPISTVDLLAKHEVDQLSATDISLMEAGDEFQRIDLKFQWLARSQNRNPNAVTSGESGQAVGDIRSAADNSPVQDPSSGSDDALDDASNRKTSPAATSNSPSDARFASAEDESIRNQVAVDLGLLMQLDSNVKGEVNADDDSQEGEGEGEEASPSKSSSSKADSSDDDDTDDINAIPKRETDDKLNSASKSEQSGSQQISSNFDLTFAGGQGPNSMAHAFSSGGGSGGGGGGTAVSPTIAGTTGDAPQAASGATASATTEGSAYSGEQIVIRYDFRDFGGFQNEITVAEQSSAEAAFGLWEQATNNQLTFVQDTTIPDSEVVIIFKGALEAVGQESSPGEILGLGGTIETRYEDGVTEFQRIILVDHTENLDTTVNNGNPAGTYDFATIVGHEIGHVLGLEDSTTDVVGDIMNANYDQERGLETYQYAVDRNDPTTSINVTSPEAAALHGLHAMFSYYPQLSAVEVTSILEYATQISPSEDAIIAIVDRGGRILGVRVEAGVNAGLQADPELRTFAIDGAVAKARTAAFFSNGDPINGTFAPLTSRLVRFISQSTVTFREVSSNPNSTNEFFEGPGFVAPIGLGGHFPPEIMFTPPVDLFAIEHTNRDSIVHPGEDGVRGTADDITLTNRFNIDTAWVPLDTDGDGFADNPDLSMDGMADSLRLSAPESYGFVSGVFPEAQSRGIATLPGGVPLFRDTDGDGNGDTLIGGIGVFFPGTDGTAIFEQNFLEGVGQTEYDRTNAPKVLEAEFIAVVAAGGSNSAPGAAKAPFHPIADLDVPFGRLDLVGIQLEVIGPTPGILGVRQLLAFGNTLEFNAKTGPLSGDINGTDEPVTIGGDLSIAGECVPFGWLVTPHDGGDFDGDTNPDITAAEVEQIINQSRAEAALVRAAVRLPISSRTRMVFAVTDLGGEVLGLYRMRDATVFSIDVAVAKARNTAYYADATAIQTVDQIPGVPDGTAFTNRTIRFLSEPRFPDGVDAGAPNEVFSILDDIADATGLPIGGKTNGIALVESTAAISIDAFNAVDGSVLGYDAFHPNTNFRDPGDGVDPSIDPLTDRKQNQNGIVFFPGSTPIYGSMGQLIGGFGVSGDGVDQDDVVTFAGAQGFLPPDAVVRADEVFVDGVRLPYQKFLRNPHG
ncbi:MAG: heme-binding protein [Planctomycetota bacterium]|nr:heme-binding protein [Planctomycetota bacterium]